MKKLIALVLAVVCVLGLVGCNNKTVNIDLPFEVGDVENIEMYHFVGAPVSAEKKVIVAEETIKNLYDMFEGLSLELKEVEETAGAEITSFRFNLSDGTSYELIYGCYGVKTGNLKSSTDNFEAAQFVDEKRYEAISNNKDFTFETVLSSEYKMNILRKAKEEGYFIKCVFVLTIDPCINIARVKARVAQGGHDVEEHKIVSRYAKSLANIRELLSLCDIVHVYDNTFEPVRIIRKHKEDISIFANELWSEEQILELIQ